MKINYLAVSVALALSGTAHADTVYDYTNGSNGSIKESFTNASDGSAVIMNVSGNILFDGNAEEKDSHGNYPVGISLTRNIDLSVSDITSPGPISINITSASLELDNIAKYGILMDNKVGGDAELNITDSTFNINNSNTSGNSSSATGIYVINSLHTSGAAEINIANGSSITSDITLIDAGTGIWAESYDDNATININSPGLTINVGNTSSTASVGIRADVLEDFNGPSSGNVKMDILANVNVVGLDATGIYGVTKDGRTAINSSGTVSASGPGAKGIYAEASDEITVKTKALQLTASGEGARGIVTNNTGSNGDTFITLGESTEVSGGWGADATGVGATSQKEVTLSIADTASLGAMNDSALVISAPTVTVTNKGTLTGNLTLSGDDVTVNNSGSLHLRNWQDTDGDGVRDTQDIAVSRFGGNGVLNNSGTLYLDSAEDSAGVMQAQLLGLSTFSNSGMIDMTTNGKAGDTLVISSSDDASIAGNGNYVSDGGTIAMDVVLNEGGANSQADMLIADNVVMGSAKTDLLFHNTGSDSDAALTTGDGIKVVDVRGSTSEDAFELAGQTHTLSAGQYIYRLEQNTADTDWYLVSDEANPEPTPEPEPTPDPDPTPDPTPEPTPDPDPAPSPDNGDDNGSMIRPEVAGYLANQTAAVEMMMQTYHDRYDGQLPGGEGAPALWGRITGGQSSHNSAGGQFDVDQESVRVQLGGDLLRLTSNGSDDIRFGVMGSWQRSDADSDKYYRISDGAGKTRFNMDASVEGYSVGVYGTWLSDAQQPEHFYVDSWLQYGWYDNSVSSMQSGIGDDNYDSSVWSGSLEAGYGVVLSENAAQQSQVILQPQAQVIYSAYDADSHRDGAGMSVSGYDADGVTSRLGVRLWRQSPQQVVQPFMEINWWHGTADNSLEIDNTRYDDDTPADRYEMKMGLSGNITPGLKAWGSLAMATGDNSYDSYGGMIGVKYSF